jgi:sigma-B regulation protein RsbU (phosphoserine phosphatase)
MPPTDTGEIARVTPEVRPAGYRRLMKKVEQAVAAIDRQEDIGTTIHSLIETILEKLAGELGISGGRIYERREDEYVLETTFGAAKPVPQGLEVPVSYGPLQQLLEDGAVCMDLDDPGIDRRFESLIGVQRFAAIEVGNEEYVLAFDVSPSAHRDDILFSLGILRHAINQKIRRDRLESIFEQARKIQASILPKRVPEYGAFDLWGRSEPIDAVGGDYFDYIPVTEKILGLAMADVSGHGLPAALQVRDIFMGLRMGLARDFKIVRTVERMNNIIHKSTLTSRFTSMFYGELELNGVFIYVNAGHPPPFHLAADGRVKFLEEGGPVLGPIPNASYERGFVIMKPGDLLIFYTDGVIEAQGRDDPGAPLGEFGIDRLVEVAQAHRGEPARRVVDAVFRRLDDFAGEVPFEDDRTVMAVVLPAEPDLRSTQAFPIRRGLP